MKAIFRHGDISCENKCLITTQELVGDQQHHLVDIQSLLRKHNHIFGDIPLGRPPERGFEHIIELEEATKLVISGGPKYHHVDIQYFRLYSDLIQLERFLSIAKRISHSKIFNNNTQKVIFLIRTILFL
jgi:hypothetical protein